MTTLPLYIQRINIPSGTTQRKAVTHTRVSKENATASQRNSPNTESEQETVARLFPTCEKISIDYAVMEPAAAEGLVYTHPADFGWSDLGNWQSLHEKLTKDESNNASVGNIHFYECQNCIAHIGNAKKVVCQGLDNYIISEKNGQILICKRSAEQQIKEFSSSIK